MSSESESKYSNRMHTIHGAAGDEGAIKVEHRLTDFAGVSDECVRAPAKRRF